MDLLQLYNLEEFPGLRPLDKVDILYYRDFGLLTSNEKIEGESKEIEYYVIYNRGVAATIGSSLAHKMGKKVIFFYDKKDLSYESLKKEGDLVFEVDSYTEKEKISIDKVKQYLLEIGLNINDNHKLEILSENENLLKLLKFCKNNNIDYKKIGIDPWYGFKSEDANMIKACELLGINFIGPSSDAVALIGDKVSANEFAQNTELTPPPNTGELTNENIDKVLGEFIDRFEGRKIVLKRADGGGGRGQFLVDTAIDFDEAKNKLISEAKKWLEKGYKFDANLWIDNSRHVEMQVVVDKLGNIIFGTPRDCTMQRAKQKIIEETAILDNEEFKFLKEQVISFFKQVKEKLGHPYVGPATFEMLYDVEGKKYYFLEVNTRKQVELLVTEHQMNSDIISSAIKIAEGYKLKKQPENEINEKIQKKHVIEARITFEDILDKKMVEFAKKHGEDKVAMPAFSENINVLFSSLPGVYLYFDNRVLSETKQVGNYDSMVGQLVVEGKNREEAIKKLRLALSKLKVFGINTNIDLCLEILSDKDFITNNHSSRTQVVNNYIKKQQNKIERKKQIEKIKEYLSTIPSKIISALKPNNIKDNNLTFTPFKEINIQVKDILLEDLIKNYNGEGFNLEYNGSGYTLYFKDKLSLDKFKEYISENGIISGNIINKLGG